MKIMIIILVLFLGNISYSHAQFSTMDGGYIKKPIPYRYVREADVMWSRTIWRIIDLREKINFPLYYPTSKMNDRISLIDLLLYGIKKEGITVYNPDDNDEFINPMTWDDIENKFGVRNDTFYVEDPGTGELVAKVIKTEMVTSEVKKIMLKELWYFNKQNSQLEVRIIGFCPIREYIRVDQYDESANVPEEADYVLKKLFWVDFPTVRFLLSSHLVYSPYNDSQRLSFDDLFFKRRFSSFVYKESNVYDNRSIDEYKKGLDALIESNRIQDNLFVFEHDLWEY